MIFAWAEFVNVFIFGRGHGLPHEQLGKAFPDFFRATLEG
jgi:hypothetical protein